MSDKLRGYRDLLVWQKGMSLAVQTYGDVAAFPKEELFGLTNQIKRSVVSVPSNIAEGWARDTDNYFVQFLSVSRGSLAEYETQVELAYQLNFLNEEKYNKLIQNSTELSKMLNGLMQSIKKKSNKQ